MLTKKETVLRPRPTFYVGKAAAVRRDAAYKARIDQLFTAIETDRDTKLDRGARGDGYELAADPRYRGCLAACPDAALLWMAYHVDGDAIPDDDDDDE